ncbi:MAG: hypothetical protein HY301_10195 [Verrucomicrobia bacterium]|nr:hypothetical protein [Verrucomicrobiota bacterium]
MRGRAFIIASVALNLALAAALWLERAGHAVPKTAPARLIRSVITNAPRTHIIIRKENFNWAELESEDYATFIENLRGIGCPPETIRDIVVADVNEIYAKRRADLMPEDIEWWKANPQQQAAQSLVRKQRELEAERRLLLVNLLGEGWDKSTNATPRPPVILTGPVLSTLPDETKRAVQDILTRQTELMRAGRENTNGLLDVTLPDATRLAMRVSREDNSNPADPLAEAKLRQRTREELAKVLNPEQLEEFLLRWSRNATELRGQVAGADVTPEEFRTLFRALDPIEQRLQLEVTGDDATSQSARAALEKQREETLQLALGPERYRAMKMQQDPLFVSARDVAEKAGAPAEAVLPLLDLNRATEAELKRIREDQSLTDDQREEAMAAAGRAKEKSLRQLLGDAAWQKFKDGIGK